MRVAPGSAKGARGSGYSGGLAENIVLNMIDYAHLWERLAAADRQLQAVRIEVHLHVAQSSVLVPAVRLAPRRQVELLLRVACEKPQKIVRHGDIEVAVGLVVLVEEHDG